MVRSLLIAAAAITFIITFAQASSATRRRIPAILNRKGSEAVSRKRRTNTDQEIDVAVVRDGDEGNPLGVPALPLLDLNPETITMSGFDSGAIFGMQMQVAFSKHFKAFGLMAGAPYLCGQGNLEASTVCLQTPWLLDIPFFVGEAKSYASSGKIDSLDNMNDHYVLLFSAPSDSDVHHQTTVLQGNMYGQLASGINVNTIYNYSKAQHAWITDQYGNDCGYLGPDYVNNCNFDFAGYFLQQAFEEKFGWTNWSSIGGGSRGTYNASNMFDWNQVPFGANVSKNSVASRGYIYVPEQCQNKEGSKKCHLHVHFHGCDQAADIVGGTAYVKTTGLNEWAETKDIVVLYPQIAPNSFRWNPMACWDWFGYNNQHGVDYLEYATKNGIQTQMMFQIISALVLGI